MAGFWSMMVFLPCLTRRFCVWLEKRSTGMAGRQPPGQCGREWTAMWPPRNLNKETAGQGFLLTSPKTFSNQLGPYRIAATGYICLACCAVEHDCHTSMPPL